MIVELTSAEFHMAITHGHARKLLADDRGSRNRHGDTGKNDWADALGAVGEYATAKGLCVPWGTQVETGDFRPDIFGRFFVRTAFKPTGNLLIHPYELDNRIYILTTAEKQDVAALQDSWLA